MTHDDPDTRQQDEHGDSAAAVSPDTQYADPTDASGDPEPADREDTTFAAGGADTRDPATGEEKDESDADKQEPNPQGASADTVSDGPDQESGFYG